MIVIMATLGDAVGTVWTAVIDNVQNSPLFDVRVEPMTPIEDTLTPTHTLTSTPSETPNPAYSATPSNTPTEFIPPSQTPTASSTATETLIPTSISSPTPAYVYITSVSVARGTRRFKDVLTVSLSAKGDVTVSISDSQTGNNVSYLCRTLCETHINIGSSAGFLTITSPHNDNIVVSYSAR